MSSRIPLPYSPEVLKHFRNPKNVGPLENPTVQSVAGSPACGDVIKLYLRINDKEVVEKATFESYGCAANIAAASILTDLIIGKTLREAWSIKWKDISDRLGGLPPIKYHCSILAVGALKRAVRAYYTTVGNMPEWLPSDLTVEERQAVEEEELIKRIYGRQFKESIGKSDG
ncbi:MAG: iron-sulfur cluster assembly scaffold protein [Zestosphaera sp.]